MSRPVIASILAAGAINVKIHCDLIAFSHYSVVVPKLQLELDDSMNKMQQLEKLYAKLDTESCFALSDAIAREKDRYDAMQATSHAIKKWSNMHPVQRFLTWPPMLMHI
jgi:hypothetical protein